VGWVEVNPGHQHLRGDDEAASSRSDWSNSQEKSLSVYCKGIRTKSESDMSTYQDVVEDAPWKDMRTRLNNQAMFPSGPRKYIRQGNVPGDLKTYDAGTLFVATSENGAGSPALGKLWVHYDVEFFVPQVNAGTKTIIATSTVLSLYSPYTVTTSSAVIPFSTININGLSVTNASGVVTLPPGNYLYDYGGTVTSNGTSGFTDVTLIPLINSSTEDAEGGCEISQFNSTNGLCAIVSGRGYLPLPSGGTFQVNILKTAGTTGTVTVGTYVASTTYRPFVLRIFLA
jgi:hypothetical protein